MLKKLIAGTVISLAAMTGAQAAGVSVVCGDTTLGIRTTTVNPAMAGSCHAGLTNLGDAALVTLVNSDYSTTDPDIFIVELVSPDSSGTWVFSGTTGLSNIALLGTRCTTDCETTQVPEPGTLALLGLGVMGVALTRRRRQA